jgi:hypothetical protein
MPFPPEAAEEEETSVCEECGEEPCECDDESASESSSNVSASKMKGAKENPLRKWAAASEGSY